MGPAMDAMVAADALAATADATPQSSPPAAPASGATSTPVTAQPTTAAAAPAVVERKPASGVTFPLRPATTTTHVAASATKSSPTDAGSIGGALFSLVLVVGLILALGWLAKRMPGMQRGGATSQLKVVASVALGARERAVVVDVGGTQLLLGVGQGGVRALHTLATPLPTSEPSMPAPFAQVLAQHFGRKS